jgi:hypothetical protein
VSWKETGLAALGILSWHTSVNTEASNRYLNSGPPKYEAGALTTFPRCSVVQATIRALPGYSGVSWTAVPNRIQSDICRIAILSSLWVGKVLNLKNKEIWWGWDVSENSMHLKGLITLYLNNVDVSRTDFTSKSGVF